MSTATKRQPAWVDIGHRFDTPPASISDALQEAGLDWEVDLHPVHITGADGQPIDLTGKFATVRRDTGKALGVVGSRYTVLQNIDALRFVDDLSGHGDIVAAWETGPQIGVAVRFGDSVYPFGNGDGGFQPYLVFRNSHDGRGSVKCHVVNFQLVCMNQMSSISRRSLAGWSTPHTARVEQRVKLAADALALADRNSSEYTDECRRLADVAVDDEAFDQIVAGLLEDQGFEGNRLSRTCEGIRSVWSHSPTLDPELRNTGYGLMHAVTEYWDHSRRYRTGRSRFNSIMAGPARRCRDTAHRRLLTHAAG